MSLTSCRKESKYDRYLSVLREDLVVSVKEMNKAKEEFEGLGDGPERRRAESILKENERRVAQLRTKIDRINKLVAAEKGVAHGGTLMDVLMDKEKVRANELKKYREEQINRARRQSGQGYLQKKSK